MTITPALRTSARAAYRDTWRAASGAFRGDEPVLRAFREKINNDARTASQTAKDATSYEQHVKLFRDIATVLRNNIVQATKVRQTDDGTDVYHMRMRQETELGDNYTIKNPAPMPSGKREAPSAAPPNDPPLVSPSPSPSSSNRPMHYTALKRAHSQRVIPELKEEDLEESFVRGSGPGGQSINKTENNVQLLHKPTGIRVACQETRSLTQNRKIARKRLLEKLDQIANPGLSKQQMKDAKDRERARRRRKKAKKKALLKSEAAAGGNEDS